MDVFDKIKQHVSVIELMRVDGHKLMKRGARWVCRSPFNPLERTPSCYVDERRYYCFSTGERGDVFDYLEKTRGVSKKDAVEIAARMAGVVIADREWRMPGAVVRPAKVEVEEIRVLEPLDGEELKRWMDGVRYLLDRPEVGARIDAWRGFADGTCVDLARRGMCGVVDYHGERLVAFPVCFPKAGAEAVLVGYHVRLKPKERGGRAAWNFVPRGVPSLPFVLGDVASAAVIAVVEGQWDAVAFAQAAGWLVAGALWPEGVAVVGIRGAANWRHFVDNYEWSPKSHFIVVCDKDEAGERWCDEGNFVDVLEYFNAPERGVGGRVHVYEPKVGKDFNDVLKLGVREASRRQDEQV